MYYLRLFDGKLEPLTKRDQGILNTYTHWDDVVGRLDCSPEHRALASKARARMECDGGCIGTWVNLYLKGYIWDKNHESFEERKEMNKL